MKQVRTRYSNEFKVKAVELVREKGNVQTVSDQLNINRETLRLWTRAYKKGRLSLESERGVKQKTIEEMEIDRLRKELYDTKLERDILKKAVGIFSKSDR